MAAQMGARRLIGHRLLDRNGTTIGRIGQVFFDDQTDVPKWVTVRTGLFGTSENFVPLQGAQQVDDDLQVPFDKETIKDAPSFETDRHISVQQEDLVYRHYGLRPEVPGQRTAEEPERHPWARHTPAPDAEAEEYVQDVEAERVEEPRHHSGGAHRGEPGSRGTD